MQYPQDSERGAVEDHRFFPEWAERPAATGSLHEVDRNSYLAGGYAEEFGHRARSAFYARAVEADGEWRVQNGCLHPGYPECPRPVERESLDTRREAVPVGWRYPLAARLARDGSAALSTSRTTSVRGLKAMERRQCTRDAPASTSSLTSTLRLGG